MANKLSAKRQKLINDIGEIRNIAEPLARLKYEAAGYKELANPYSGLPIRIDAEGVTFYEVEQSYSWGDQILDTLTNTITWHDIDNYAEAEARLVLEINRKKREQEMSYKDSRRATYEALKKEFGDEDRQGGASG
jgi:hypothetical protein